MASHKVSSRSRQKKRRRRRRKRAGCLCITALAVIILTAAVVIVIKKMPSLQHADLEEYYGLTDAADDEIAIVLRDLPLSGDEDDEDRDRLGSVILEEKAFIMDGEVYVPLSVIKDYIDERFHYDDTDGCIVVTNAQEMMLAYADETAYTVNGEESIDAGYVIFTVRDGTAYVAMDFADEFSSAYYSTYEDPGRVVIDYISDDNTYCEVVSDTKLRKYGGKKSEIIAKISEGSVLQVKRTLSGWYEVISEDGYVGCVKAEDVGQIYTLDEESDYDEPEYTSLSLDEEIKLGWFAAYNTQANSNFYSYTYGADINVVSPTWYTLSSADGDIEMLTDLTVVNLAHSKGYQVWVMFSDGDYEYVSAVLSSTSKRQQVIEAVIADVKANSIDGINIDFERITSDIGDDFIEFIRELSIRCRQEEIYLSVDNYTPYSSIGCYHVSEQSVLCDYVIVMAYDDYVGTGQQGPNCSLSFLEESVSISLEQIASEKLIIALPFYSRFWIEDADGNLTSETYNMGTAKQKISEAGAELVWDEELGMYTAVYTDSDGNTVYAYLENAESINAKLSLLSEYSLAGTAFWRLNQELSSVWDVVENY